MGNGEWGGADLPINCPHPIPIRDPNRLCPDLPGFARHPASPRPHRTQPKGNFEFGGRPDVLKAFGDSVRGYTVYLLQIQYDKSPPSIGRAVAGVALRHVINQIDL